jgi:CheY-like chemotaxis protein
MAKILIAEDEPDIRELVAFTLRFAGYEVVSASNGEEAIQLAKDELPDLILMDVRMPRMTGYEACKILKQIPTWWRRRWYSSQLKGRKPRYRPVWMPGQMSISSSLLPLTN